MAGEKKQGDFSVDLKTAPDEIVKNAILSPEIPKIYANDFITAHGHSDTLIIFQNNGLPIAVLNLSFTTAKTLAEKLQDVIAKIEKKSGIKIMTANEFDDKFKKKS